MGVPSMRGGTRGGTRHGHQRARCGGDGAAGCGECWAQVWCLCVVHIATAARRRVVTGQVPEGLLRAARRARLQAAARRVRVRRARVGLVQPALCLSAQQGRRAVLQRP